MGNDIRYEFRRPTPGIPIHYPVEGLDWLPSLAPRSLNSPPSLVFDTPEKAVDYLREIFTLTSPKASIIDRIFAKSVLMTRIWGGIKFEYRKAAAYFKIRGKTPQTYHHFTNIMEVGNKLEIPVLFTGVPTAEDVKRGEDLNKKYDYAFKDIPYHFPENLQREDYEADKRNGHFITSGNEKYAAYLLNLIDSLLASNP